MLAGPLTAALTFEPGEYAARRARFMEKIPDGAAVFLGASAPASDVAFRQGHDFVYLTGVPIPNAFLVVDGLRKESVLFFTMTETEAESEGIPREFVRDAKDFTGIERVLPADQFGPFLAGLCQRTRVLYTMFKPEEIGPENANEKFNALQRTMTLEPVGRAAHPGAPVRQAARRQVPPGRDQGLLPPRLGVAQDQVARRARGHAPDGPDRRQGPPGPDPVDPAGHGRKGARVRVRVRLRARGRGGSGLLPDHHVRKEPRLRPLQRL